MSVLVFLAVAVLFLYKTKFIWWPVLKYIHKWAETRNQRAENEARAREEAQMRQREEEERYRRFHTYPMEPGTTRDVRPPRALRAPEDAETTDG